ncbi:DinB family protein [Solitalea canadensis]|uniref:DinB-like domain-containing protein n=1 Tax=Solitalea canadensis (strain ATCC 29591 / DSM 3403 / JCM 21819 / LMG 8368 / NBRC 15130 / NCIMB 12057 / USAM 9D) TaxID=929556 RepID=H8KT26_SOLCM|nr:DinB family protein [Solitalea canadensis]AFD05597.1 hypothetical protein Solca_0465 [Solitalea canadensis DSM 3403]
MKTTLLENLEKSRNYTIQTAQSMPENKFDFKPVDEVWSFKELIHHIAYCIQWMEDNFLKNKEADWAPPSVKGSKSEIIDYINKAYADVTSTIKGVEKLTDAQINGVYAIIDHSTHHRGQAVTYLRCNHIDPPEYVFLA